MEYLRFLQVYPVRAIDKKAGAIPDRVDDGFMHFFWQCRATLAAA